MKVSQVRRDSVVVGGSAGGIPALRDVAALPADFPAAIFIVIHAEAQAPSRTRGATARLRFPSV